MANAVTVDSLLISLPTGDSTHDLMPDSELVTLRLRDESGLEGLGYTYAVGRAGRAIHAVLEH
jgi:hypothetical protein